MTIFSKIIAREIPAKIIYEDDVCLAFHDVHPQAPVHALIIPKKAIESMAKVSDEDQEILGHLMLKASHVANLLNLSPDGYRLVINTNSHGGQTVYHLHVHILGGRFLTWPPG